MGIADVLLKVVEYVGVISFAISGAIEAIRFRLDLFGVLLVAGVTALGGGVFRDILLGFFPPHMFTSYVYLLVAAISAFAVFLAAFLFRGKEWKSPETLGWVMNFVDALGLGSFVAAGTGMSMSMGYADNLFLCVFMGTITGVGGGFLRDVMLRNIPAILRKDVYALACVAGSNCYFVLAKWLDTQEFAAAACLVVTVSLRLLAYRYRWNLPRVRFPNDR